MCANASKKSKQEKEGTAQGVQKRLYQKLAQTGADQVLLWRVASPLIEQVKRSALSSVRRLRGFHAEKSDSCLLEFEAY